MPASTHASNDGEALLRIAGRLARIGGWSVDLADGLVHWSDEVAAIHEMPPGYSPPLEDALGFYPPESRPRIVAAFEACAGEGIPYDEEVEFITATGRRIWVRAMGSAIRDASGKVVRVEGAFQDVTERKQVQVKLAESEESYRALFENMTAGFVLFEVIQDECGKPLDLVILAANKGFEEATGLRIGEVVGRRLTHVLPGIERDAADWIGTYGGVALTGRPVQFERASELLGLHYHVSAYPSGAMRCAVTFTDVTERKRAEHDVRLLHDELKSHAAELELRVAERTSELEAAKVQAEAADRAKSSFLATMSHELRTPLNSIIGFTEVVLEGLSGPLTDEQVKHLGFVRQSAGQLLALIGDVLDIARVEAGQLRLILEPLDLCGLLDHVHGVFRAEADRRGLQFTLSSSVTKAVVTADRRRVEQVLNNLLSNALKFTPHGTIALSLDRADGEFRVVVSDTGVGIRPDDVGRLFQRFSQAETGLLMPREGAGLGLAISKHLIEAMGGHIWVDSEWGSGSRFGFSLPPARDTHE